MRLRPSIAPIAAVAMEFARNGGGMNTDHSRDLRLCVSRAPKRVDVVPLFNAQVRVAHMPR